MLIVKASPHFLDYDNKEDLNPLLLFLPQDFIIRQLYYMSVSSLQLVQSKYVFDMFYIV